MKKSEWLDCQRNELFPKQKGIPSLVKIEHINTATLDSARSKKKSKVAVLQLIRQTGEAGNQTCDPWFTRQAVYPLHYISLYTTYTPQRLLNKWSDCVAKRPMFHLKGQSNSDKMIKD